MKLFPALCEPSMSHVTGSKGQKEILNRGHTLFGFLHESVYKFLTLTGDDTGDETPDLGTLCLRWSTLRFFKSYPYDCSPFVNHRGSLDRLIHIRKQISSYPYHLASHLQRASSQKNQWNKKPLTMSLVTSSPGRVHLMLEEQFRIRTSRACLTYTGKLVQLTRTASAERVATLLVSVDA